MKIFILAAILFIIMLLLPIYFEQTFEQTQEQPLQKEQSLPIWLTLEHRQKMAE